MENSKGGSFPGHDEGTNKPPAEGSWNSPATFAPNSSEPSSVNTKTDMGTSGKADGK